jgi:hypothetical protein
LAGAVYIPLRFGLGRISNATDHAWPGQEAHGALGAEVLNRRTPLATRGE